MCVFVVQKTKKTFGTILEIKQKKAIIQMRGKQYRDSSFNVRRRYKYLSEVFIERVWCKEISEV